MSPIRSVMYVSSSLIEAQHREELEKILKIAKGRNAALAVTGAIIFTGSHFAQVLEGRAAAVDELMASIVADVRHTSIEVIEVADLEERNFASWSMAYSGPSTYVDQLVRPLLRDIAELRTQRSKTRSLLRLMKEFAVQGGVEHR